MEIYGHEKIILDATAGFRIMWFNKDHPNAVYLDERTDEEIYQGYCASLRVRNRPALKVRRPKTKTVLSDFKHIPYSDNSFTLVVFDPPYHIKLSNSSWVNMRWGKLKPETWQSDLKQGFDECWRVLKPTGILIFKWNDKDIGSKQILKVLDRAPLFGHRFKNNTVKGTKRSTFWFCFMKIPKSSVDAKLTGSMEAQKC